MANTQHASGFVCCLWEALWCLLITESVHLWPSFHVWHHNYCTAREQKQKKKLRAKDCEHTCVSSHAQCKISAKNLFLGFARSWTVMRKRPGPSAPWMIIQSDLWHPPQCEDKHVLWLFISGCLTLVWLCYSVWPRGEMQQMFPFQWIWWLPM